MERSVTALAVPSCRSSARRVAARGARLSGIDFVDYQREPSPRLAVHLFGPAAQQLSERSFVIEGGRRVRDVKVTRLLDVDLSADGADACISVELDREGDYSAYVLRVVDAEGGVPEGFDPYYVSASFGFKLDCPGLADCADAQDGCASTTAEQEPALDYLAKDYASFRRLLFDRLSLTLPDFRETHLPDIGVTLVELMAYIGDRLSYEQDAVATEAYLGTARLRTSVRRHARLVDYRMHEGCNARAWVVICSEQDVTLRCEDLMFITRVGSLPNGLVSADDLRAAGAAYDVFLPLTEASEIRVRAELGRIVIYTWGGEECCLPRGATRATLAIENRAPAAEKDAETAEDSEAPPLGAGDVIVLEEVLGPATGRPEDADPKHRHAVRLTSVERVVDPLQGPSQARLFEVTWAAEDALPFDLCLSTLDPEHGCAPRHDISLARGNVVLVDHGRSYEADLGCVEEAEPTPTCEKPGRLAPSTRVAKPFAPTLPHAPIAHAAPPAKQLRFDAEGRAQSWPLPASLALAQQPKDAVPLVELSSGPCCTKDEMLRCPRCGAAANQAASPQAAWQCPACRSVIEPLTWLARADLLSSHADDTHFVAESDDRARVHLRFGDGTNGRRPEPDTRFVARYRVGGGTAGNVPEEAIAHVLIRGEASGLVLGVRNPLPARGGVDPEDVDDVRELAPFALRGVRERAITGDDYAELALRDHPELQRAAGALQWTGSWYEALVGLDPLHSTAVPKALLFSVEHSLERYRRIGHDLRVKPAELVALNVAVHVCAAPGYLREQVQARVRAALVPSSAGVGLFAPDRLTFGAPVALSRLIAAVQAVPGVADVEVTTFERLFEGDHGELDAGALEFSPLEIPLLDADPSQPERGVLSIDVGGGR